MTRVEATQLKDIMQFMRYNEADNDFALYTCLGVLMRCARKLGLHIDPTMLGADNNRAMPFTAIEIEQRRRLWHEILYLDVMLAEPAGIDPEPLANGHIWPSGTLTRLPSNLSDDDLETIAITQLDRTHRLVSDMSLQLVRLRVGLCIRYGTLTIWNLYLKSTAVLT